MKHLSRHLVHVVLVVTALLMFRVADVELSVPALAALMVACIAAFEGGMWIIHRRDASRATSATP